MNSKKNILITLTLFFLITKSVCQNVIIDSLEKTLTTNIPDTLKVLNMFKIFSESAKIENRAREKESAENSLKFSEAIQYPFGIAKANSACGLYHYHVGEYQNAIEYDNKSILKATEIGDRKLLANVLSNLGNVYMYLSDYEKAMNVHKQSYQIRKELNDQAGMATSLNNIGIIYHELSDYPKALDCYLEGLKIFRERGDKTGIVFGLNNIGGIYYAMTDFDKAMDYHLQSLEIALRENNKSALALSYSNIGNVYYDKNNIDSAIFYYQKAMNIAEEVNDKNIDGGYYTRMGIAFNRQGNFGKAKAYLSKAILRNRERGNKKNLSESLIESAELYNKLQLYDSALVFANESFDIAYNLKTLLIEVKSATSLSKIYENQNQFKEALKYKAIAAELNDSIFHEKTHIDINKYKIKAELDKQEFELTTRAKAEQAKMEAIIKKDKEIQNLKLLRQIQLAAINKSEYGKKQAELELLAQKQNLTELNAKKLEAEITTQALKNQKISADNNLLLKNKELQDEILIRQKLIRNFSITGIVLILIFGGYSFYRFRKQKKLENKQSLLNERLRISRDLHDEIGSTLGSISVYSEVAKNRAVKNETDTEVLTKIGTASRELIDKMSDIVWSLNSQNETFEHLKNRIQSFAAIILPPHNIAVDFNFDEQLKTTELTSEQMKNLFLIFKEAIYNVVKYAEATDVKVTVTVKENVLRLEVIDNGKGFDVNKFQAYNGNGLKNMKARSNEMKGKIIVDSKINEGTKIELELNV